MEYLPLPLLYWEAKHCSQPINTQWQFLPKHKYGNRCSAVKWSSKCPGLSGCWDQRELLRWGWRKDGKWIRYDSSTLSAWMYLEEEQAYGNQGGGGKALIPEPSSSALGFLLKKQKRAGKESFQNQQEEWTYWSLGTAGGQAAAREWGRRPVRWGQQEKGMGAPRGLMLAKEECSYDHSLWDSGKHLITQVIGILT